MAGPRIFAVRQTLRALCIGEIALTRALSTSPTKAAARLAAREAAVVAAESGGEPTLPGDPTDHAAADPRPGGWAELRHALGNGGYRAALAVNFVTGLTVFGLRAALIPLFVVQGLEQGPSLSGWAFLVAAVVQAIFLVPAGRMTDLRGRRPAMLIGSIATIGGMLLLVVDDLATGSLSIALVIFFASMAVMAVGTAFLGSAPSAVVGDIMGGRQGGSVVATFQMVSDFGGVIGPLLGGLLLDLFGFEWAFAFGAAISVLALIFVIAMPETLRSRPADTPA